MLNKKDAESKASNVIVWKKWLTEDEAAAYLGLAPVTLRKWRENGRTSKGETPPPCFKRGTQYYYSGKALDAWIESGIALYADGDR